MKSFILALSMAFVMPAFAQATTTPSGVKVAKKKEKKSEPAKPAKKQEAKKQEDKK